MDAATAIALLVKTPGHSPVKTRLAQAIGLEEAHEFHRLSAIAMADSLKVCQEKFPERIAPYWAVAEDSPEAFSQWEGFPILHQGGGDFASRLAQVYRRLKIRHPSVVLAAADSPEMSPALWLSAWRALQMPGSVVGPAADGGFYLVGSNLELPDALWESLPLSTPRVCEILYAELEKLGPCRRLKTLDDIDHGDDLIRLSERLGARRRIPRGLTRIAEWLEDKDETRLPG